jgi:prepilin-type N-terminal cleavage/methylation domain-containing protein
MNRAYPRHGVPGPLGEGGCLFFSLRHIRRGFTLLEMCMVLFIIALLFGMAMPAIQSAFVEQAVRSDAHQLALMVKTAMIQSAEQHRAYVVELTATTMALHPMGETSADPDAPPSTDDDAATAAKNSAMASVDVTSKFNPPNQLLVPDLHKVNAWIAMPPTSWVFQPGELCPATHVRLARGDAWLEMSFDALTGNVTDETYSLP